MTFRKSCVGWKRAVQSKRRTSQLARIPVLFRNTKEIDMKRKRMTGVRIIIAQSGADGVEVLSASLDAVLAVTAAVVSAASEASSGSSVLVKLTRCCCRGGGGDGGWRRGGCSRRLRCSRGRLEVRRHAAIFSRPDMAAICWSATRKDRSAGWWRRARLHHGQTAYSSITERRG